METCIKATTIPSRMPRQDRPWEAKSVCLALSILANWQKTKVTMAWHYQQGSKHCAIHHRTTEAVEQFQNGVPTGKDFTLPSGHIRYRKKANLRHIKSKSKDSGAFHLTKAINKIKKKQSIK